MMIIKLSLSAAHLLPIVVVTGFLTCWSHSFVSAQTIPADSTVILRQLTERDLDQALESLGELVDQPLTFRDLAYSSLPSAAAGVNRSLAQLSADEQFDRLEKWTLPSEDRKHLRLLAVPVPADAPPRVFGRSLGQRPVESTFAIASVGPVRGFFCSGWMLVQAADEVGRLARLRSTLEELETADVAGATELLMLAYVAGSRGDLDRVKSYLQTHVADDPASAGDLSPDAIPHAAIASAALLHPELQPFAEALLDHLVDRGGQADAIALRPFLRIAHATAVQVYRGQSSPEVLFENRLKYWVPATVRSSTDIQRGQPSGVWLSHEHHLLHLAGGNTDVLLFRFPLVGEFEFVCETQEGGAIGTDGGLVYGGLQFQALGRKDTLQIWDADSDHPLIRPSPFARYDVQPVFNHVSIHSSDDGAKFESNFHPVWFDDAAVGSSPWIGLRSSGTKRPVFRNIQIHGTPTIPREVRLTSGDQLRGWQSGFFAETQPPFRAAAETEQETTSGFDWQLHSGELHAAKQEDDAAARKPGLLQYQRPLLEGEKVQYEFMYNGDGTIVHPAIGRLAYLLESGGVRVRWITSGETEWTGLQSDNAAIEPLNRRGPRTLPLKENQWNVVTIKRFGGKCHITLNDELIYQRADDFDVAPQIGLYRSERTETSRVRNVLLTGDWPETLPSDFATDPLDTVERPLRSRP
ncbi:DUF1583 domain-containing protein [Novipirellula caenicola]|uniref:3-keto-disaccharide hydrolase domain-containing protein n=1 Tax=Novipirellula caenicola TaxID=1536901 RepID=A0ABP9VXH7_9BACT